MDTIQILTSLIENGGILTILTSVVTIASAITAVTGTPAAGTTASKLYRILDLLALNVLKSKDKGK